jgi:hypothetical protein
MAALGGKREKGAVNEKKARKDDFCAANRFTAGLGRRVELMERQTRKKEAKKKSTRMAARGVRIVKLPPRETR